MKRTAKWFLASVIVLDLIVLVSFLGSELTASWAQSTPPSDADAGPETVAHPDNPWSTGALAALGKELRARRDALELREQELEELARGAEVLEQAAAAGLTAPAGEAPIETEAAPQSAPAPTEPVVDPEAERMRSEAFDRLSKAYAAMEPDGAAQALAALARRDQRAVVQLLIDWQPRTSGAILDALTQRDAALAAELSYEIWKLSGKAATP